MLDFALARYLNCLFNKTQTAYFSRRFLVNLGDTEFLMELKTPFSKGAILAKCLLQ